MLGIAPRRSTEIEIEPVEEAAPESQEAAAEVAEPEGIACPSCGYLIDPPPQRDRKCPACREQIVVRRIDGRFVYLTAQALDVYLAERQRDADDAARDLARTRWLDLAATVGVPTARHRRLSAAAPTEDVVDAARDLYWTAADMAARTAKREGRWIDVARIRRGQAAAAYAAAGSPIPPPADAVALHREGMLAVLRSFGTTAAAELVSAGCCRVCRTDDSRVFKVAAELREPRLPHEGCTKGICACEWWLGTVERKRRRRRTASTPTP